MKITFSTVCDQLDDINQITKKFEKTMQECSSRGANGANDPFQILVKSCAFLRSNKN